MKKIHLTFLLFCISILAFSQEGERPGFYKKIAIGVSGGTTGAGFDIAKNFSKINLTLGINYFAVKDLEQQMTIQNERMDMKLSLKSISVDFKVEYVPFDWDSFKLFAGVAYIPENQIEATGKYANDVTFGEIVLTPDDLGEIYFSGEWAKFAPFFGIGLGRPVPLRKVGFGMDVGAYYMGDPKVTFTGTEMFSDMESQEEQLEQNLQGYSWLPLIKLRLSYRIN